MRPYATEGQKGAKNVGPFFAPRTRLGLMARATTRRGGEVWEDLTATLVECLYPEAR